MTQNADIYIEISSNGNALEVAAIHSQTGREVRFMAPKTATELEIKQLARSKMDYVENKSKRQDQRTVLDTSRKGGIIV